MSDDQKVLICAIPWALKDAAPNAHDARETFCTECKLAVCIKPENLKIAVRYDLKILCGTCGHKEINRMLESGEDIGFMGYLRGKMPEMN
jgi:superfamily II helicase